MHHHHSPERDLLGKEATRAARGDVFQESVSGRRNQCLSSATRGGYVNAQRLTRASDIHPGNDGPKTPPAVPRGGRGTQYSAVARRAPLVCRHCESIEGRTEMKQLSRVVWNEGMHLAQHHFQAQSRYFEDAIQFAISSLFFAPYGLVGCELDSEAIRNDTVSLIHARGMMPDGLPFDIPASDTAPEPIDVRELFSPTQQSHLVLLTIPAYRADRPNFGQNGETNGSHARYQAEAAPMLDDTTGRDEKSVSLGRKNLRLALDLEQGEDVVSLPIARVKRDGAGHFMYDPEYVPPCVQVGASTRLMQLLGRLIEILDAKSDFDGARPTRQRRGICATGSRELLASARDRFESTGASTHRADQARPS